VDAHGDVGGGAVFEELQERSSRRRAFALRYKNAADEGSRRTGHLRRGGGGILVRRSPQREVTHDGGFGFWVGASGGSCSSIEPDLGSKEPRATG
jgi:hypothetical protein